MRLTRQKIKFRNVELDMAAMIDVVMLLLIFFMCTVTFRLPEQGIDAQVADVKVGEGLRMSEYEPVQIELSKVGDGVAVRCDGQLCDTFEALRGMLRQRRGISNVEVIVKGDADVEFWYMVTAVDCCYDVGLRRVAFSPEGAI